MTLQGLEVMAKVADEVQLQESLLTADAIKDGDMANVANENVSINPPPHLTRKENIESGGSFDSKQKRTISKSYLVALDVGVFEHPLSHSRP